jgi:hypothetical protein
VNWEEEEACFEGVSSTLARCYSDVAYPEDSVVKRQYIVEHILFPAMKSSYFVPPQELNESITPIACLTNLYKIFERC